jgi:orotidine-5'-phosphate decarboxylase
MERALGLVDQLAGAVGLFKVGLELFIQAGPEGVRQILDRGRAPVFLDLKLHDIPTTVERAMSRVADLGVAFVTVHCGESPEMLEAAVRGAGGKVGILAVTVLTSVSSENLATAGFPPELSRDPTRLVIQRAAMAKTAGLAGVICSGREARGIKKNLGAGFLAVTPGIRPAWSLEKGSDQKRITTPAQAIAAGADYLVIGRPIRDADDPAEAAGRIAREIENARSGAD